MKCLASKSGDFGFLVTLLILFCSGCAKHHQIENDLQSYAERLQDFTLIRVEPLQANYTLQAPKKSALKQELPTLNINLREFYAFNDCTLNQLVAQRNTSLGKMQLPSTRFVYETQLISELKSCINYVNDNGEDLAISSKLKEWLAIKEQQLPIVWTNLFTQSDEIYNHLTMASGFISGKAADDLQATKQAFTFLLNAELQHPVNLSELEYHLQQLRNSPLLARLWRTQLLISQQLDNISPLLEQYLAKNTCATLQQKEDLKIMRNIFKMFFADKIQPLGGELNRYHYLLSPLMIKITQATTGADAFSQFINHQVITQHEMYKESMSRHIKLWQKVFGRCD